MDFINEYWNCVGGDQHTNKIRQNRHFSLLNSYIVDKTGLPAEIEGNVNCKYRKSKKWDLHFREQKVAIEYKTITSKSLQKCKYLRVEEAIGCAVDVKSYDPEYRLGYLVIFAFDKIDPLIERWRDWMIDCFDNLLLDGIYDMFCPIQTTGPNNYEFMFEDIDGFIKKIKL
jgi:hypothetical protein